MTAAAGARVLATREHGAVGSQRWAGREGLCQPEQRGALSPTWGHAESKEEDFQLLYLSLHCSLLRARRWAEAGGASSSGPPAPAPNTCPQHLHQDLPQYLPPASAPAPAPALTLHIILLPMADPFTASMPGLARHWPAASFTLEYSIRHRFRQLF